MTRKDHPTKRQVLDSAESFYGLRLTPDREFIIQLSTWCTGEHDSRTFGAWCPLAHEGKPGGSLFWCPCECHRGRVGMN